MTERELERQAQRRLAVLRHVEEVSFNVAATCRYVNGQLVVPAGGHLKVPTSRVVASVC